MVGLVIFEGLVEEGTEGANDVYDWCIAGAQPGWRLHGSCLLHCWRIGKMVEKW